MLRFSKLVAAVGLLSFSLTSYAEDVCDSRFNNTSELSCISCGIQAATGQVPSEKYLALLGFAAQHYYANVKVSAGGEEKDNFYRHVIQQVQAYGFCLGVKIDRNGVPTDKIGYGKVDLKMQDLIYPAVTGSKSRTVQGEYVSGMTSKQTKEVVKYFGFKEETDIRNIFQDDGWRYLNPAERQKIFRTYAEKGGIFNGDTGEALQNCFDQIKQLQTKDTIFNLRNGVRSDNQKFCKTVSAECGIDSAFCVGSAPKNTSSGTAGGSSGRSLFESTKGNTGTK